MNLNEIADEISRRLISVFQSDSNGRRPVFGANEKFQFDPHWANYIPFHEYFHGDHGAGIGASHQTGWTALVAKMIEEISAKPKCAEGMVVTAKATHSNGKDRDYRDASPALANGRIRSARRSRL